MFYFFLYFNVFMYVFIYAAVLGLGCGVRALSSWPVTASGCVHLLAAALGAHGRPRALCRRGGLLSPAGPSFSSRGLVEMQSAGSRALGLAGSRELDIHIQSFFSCLQNSVLKLKFTRQKSSILNVSSSFFKVYKEQWLQEKITGTSLVV